MEQRLRGEISTLSLVFVGKGNQVAQRLIKEGIKEAAVWKQVEPFTNVRADSRCQHGRGWGHMESKCSGTLACGNCSRPHRTNTYQCNVVGCSAKQGSLCGPT